MFWIDVGAFDPILCSVTKYFSLRGGDGINIEPQLAYCEKYKTDRPDDLTLNCGVGNIADRLGVIETLWIQWACII